MNGKNIGHLRIEAGDVSIYEREDLLEKLNLQGSDFPDEVLLQYAYEKWGVRCVEHLIGDFAFALYDQGAECYFCARDQLGVRPLYYSIIEQEFFFANDIDELFTKYGVNKHPNKQAIDSLINQYVIDYSATMYEDVYRLPPGHWMLVSDGQRQVHRYWYPERIKINQEITREEAADRFRELFDRAIHSRINDYRTTAFELSGGLDSSSIVSYHRHTDPIQPLNVYAMHFGEMGCDESVYINSVAEKHGLFPHYLRSDRIDYTVDYDMAFNYRVNPHWPLLVTFTTVFPMLEQMSTEGIRTIISGQGGDHIHTGSPYVLADYLKHFKLYKLTMDLYYTANRMYILKNFVVSPLLNRYIKKILKKLLGRGNKTSQQFSQTYDSFIEPASVASLALRQELQWLTAPSHSMILDSSVFHVVKKLYGIEYRHPFFDIRLVEFMLSLPPEFKFSKGMTKQLLRRAMKGILPEKIRTRQDKAEFSDVLLQQIDAIDLKVFFANPKIVEFGFIELQTIDGLIQSYHQHELTIHRIVFFWRIINIEYWYQYHFGEVTSNGMYES